jgi:hypothetical protein
MEAQPRRSAYWDRSSRLYAVCPWDPDGPGDPRGFAVPIAVITCTSAGTYDRMRHGPPRPPLRSMPAVRGARSSHVR